MGETEITKAKAAPLARHNEVADIRQLMQAAIEQGADGVANLEKLFDLHERVAKREAAKEFAHAMAAFQAECGSIFQGRRVDELTKKGQRLKFTHTKLQDIIKAIKPVAAKYGLSFTWPKTETDATHITEHCLVKHINGHTSSGNSTMPIDSTFVQGSQQKVVMASTFARRESLAKAFGVVTTDIDESAPPPDFITAEQAAEIAQLITKSGRPEANVLKWQGVAAIGEIHLSKFDEVVAMLKKAIKAKEKTDGDK